MILGLFAAWRIGDVDAVLAYCSDDIVYDLHVPPELSRYHGELIGKHAVGTYLREVRAVWEFVWIEPGPLLIEGGLAREVSRFRTRLKRSGEVFESTKRHIWHVEFGLVTRCEEFQDTPLIRAFVGMAGGLRDTAVPGRR